MTPEITYAYQISPIWDTIKAIRAEVGLVLNDYPPKVREACQMTISELIENAIKYGMGLDSSRGIRVEFGLKEQHFHITVANRLKDPTDYADVQRLLNQLNAPGADPRALYIERLRDIMADLTAVGKTQLGFYRITYEGQFHLSYSFEQEILRITAERAI